MEATSGRAGSPPYAKWALFAALGVATIAAVVTADRFLIDPHNPEWKHIAPFQWVLLVHALAGVTALLLGPFQFSSRLRRTHLAWHRAIGRMYAIAVLIASSIAMYLGIFYEPWPLNAQQPSQYGGWFLSTLIAYIAIRNGHLALHRVWAMRSYAFTLVFVLSRLPFWRVNNATELTTLLWWLIVGAIVVPELILTLPQILRSRTRG